MKNINACLSHNSDDWCTPTWLYDLFSKYGYIDTFKFQSTEDEFKNRYFNQKLFCNPPFSKLDQVIDWIIAQYESGCKIALLIPSRTDTKYFHKLINTLFCRICFIKGRLKYNDSLCAPFPSMLIIIDSNTVGNFYFSVDSTNIEDFIK